MSPGCVARVCRVCVGGAAMSGRGRMWFDNLTVFVLQGFCAGSGLAGGDQMASVLLPSCWQTLSDDLHLLLPPTPPPPLPPPPTWMPMAMRAFCRFMSRQAMRAGVTLQREERGGQEGGTGGGGGEGEKGEGRKGAKDWSASELLQGSTPRRGRGSCRRGGGEGAKEWPASALLQGNVRERRRSRGGGAGEAEQDSNACLLPRPKPSLTCLTPPGPRPHHTTHHHTPHW